MLYLDCAATVPMKDCAIEEMNRIMRNKTLGNPSSLHAMGWRAKDELENCRKRIAEIMGYKPENIYFTSGAAEGNTWVLESLAQHCAATGRKVIISSKAEHMSIINKLKQLESRGFIVNYIEDFKGETLVSKVKNAMVFDKANNCQVGFISLMYVNNETGNISDFNGLYDYCHRREVIFHTDITQAIPHISVFNVKADLMTCSAHKFGGPRGVGFVYSKYSAHLKPFIMGGKQEFALRGGTENLAAIAGMTAALEETTKNYSEDSTIKNNFMLLLKNEINDIEFHSDVNCIPTINFYIPNVSSEVLVSMLNGKEIYVSTASACSSGATEPSHVLKALGYSDKVAANSIRISYGNEIDTEVIKYIVNEIKKCVAFIRGNNMET